MREYLTDRCCALGGGDIVTSEDSVVEQLLERLTRLGDFDGLLEKLHHQ